VRLTCKTLRGVIDDDLPAVVGIFEDEGEETFGAATVFFAAFQVVLADDDGEVFIERMDLEVGVRESAHSGFIGVVVFVLVEQAGEAAEDLVGDKERVRRVFISLGETSQIAFIPGVLLGDKNLDDVEFLASSSVERVRFLRRKKSGREKGETEGGEAKRGAKIHRESRRRGVGSALL